MENKKKYIPIEKRWENDGFAQVKPSNITQCFFCKHIIKGETCNAFPKGISREILLNNVIHNKSYSGDNGIIFEPEKEEYRNICFESLTFVQKF